MSNLLSNIFLVLLLWAGIFIFVKIATGVNVFNMDGSKRQRNSSAGYQKSFRDFTNTYSGTRGSYSGNQYNNRYQDDDYDEYGQSNEFDSGAYHVFMGITDPNNDDEFGSATAFFTGASGSNLSDDGFVESAYLAHSLMDDEDD